MSDCDAVSAEALAGPPVRLLLECPAELFHFGAVGHQIWSIPRRKWTLDRLLPSASVSSRIEGLWKAVHWPRTAPGNMGPSVLQGDLSGTSQLPLHYRVATRTV